MTPQQQAHRAILEGISGQLVSIGDEPEILVNSPGIKEQVVQLIRMLRSAMYPHVFGATGAGKTAITGAVRVRLEDAARMLGQLLEVLDPAGQDNGGRVLEYLRRLPDIKAILETDIQAVFQGDPAAENVTEILLSYPAFEAISIYRLAHELYVMGVPSLPRLMTEHAHHLTGIDIHPGASIGRYFFIDHGTGVVIGETATVGEHVRLYQGVTLGAKRLPPSEAGRPEKAGKRHPDIGDNVIIYANATILGGDTRIGDNCVIGGNVWLTHSVEDGSTVLAAQERDNKKFYTADRP